MTNAGAQMPEGLLVQASKAGDEAAFEGLFEHHRHRLWGFIRFRSQTDSEALEILDMTRQQAWRYVYKIRPNPGAFWGFTRQTAVFMIKRYYTHRWNQGLISGPGSLASDEDLECVNVGRKSRRVAIENRGTW